jgi:hypothetical protein
MLVVLGGTNIELSKASEDGTIGLMELGWDVLELDTLGELVASFQGSHDTS